MFGMSCLKKWIKDLPSDKCPQCYQNFSLESVRHLYAPRLCIPAAAANQKASIRSFSFSKIGVTTFKQYERDLRTNAINNRKRADVLERPNDAMKRLTELLDRMTDEEEWAEASEQQADAEKRAEVFRHKAAALGQWADEYLRKADAFGQQAKALRQQAKSLRQLVDSYLASRKFYIQSYREFLGSHDKISHGCAARSYCCHWIANLAEFAYAEQQKTLISIPPSVLSRIESNPILSVNNQNPRIMLAWWSWLSIIDSIGQRSMHTPHLKVVLSPIKSLTS